MKKKLMVGVAGLAAVALVGGTFAYFTQTTTIDNPFNTAYYRTSVTEQFNPTDGEKWEPGTEVNKDLYVQNSGDRDVVVRVKFEEKWSRKIAQTDDGRIYESVVMNDNDRYVTTDDTYQASATDGMTEEDKSVVTKFFADGTVGGTWSERQPDGYYYYKAKLAPGASTGKFLDSVKLIADVDMGQFWSTVFYKIDKKDAVPNFNPDSWEADGWTLFKTNETTPLRAEGTKMTVQALSAKDIGLTDEEEAQMAKDGNSIFTNVSVEADKDHKGYSDADYVLSITIDTVQATDEAVAQFFGTPGQADTYAQDIYTSWELDKETLEDNVTTAAPEETTEG